MRSKHLAVVLIGFDESMYWIDYKESINLNYSPNDYRDRYGRRATLIKGPRIHRNYNIWVDRLADQIAVRAKHPPRAKESESSEDNSTIANELEKLDGLRQRGVLTDAEFDQLKVRLLAK